MAKEREREFAVSKPAFLFCHSAAIPQQPSTSETPLAHSDAAYAGRQTIRGENEEETYTGDGKCSEWIIRLWMNATILYIGLGSAESDLVSLMQAYDVISYVWYHHVVYKRDLQNYAALLSNIFQLFLGFIEYS